MSTLTLSQEQLGLLFGRVFEIRGGDRAMAIMVDLPCEGIADDEDWAWLRATARQWRDDFPRDGENALERVDILVYPATGNTNLPDQVAVCNFEFDPESGVELRFIPTEEVLARYQIVVAMTRFSVTRELKATAKRISFRCVTMPGFTAAMVPAMFLDYAEVGRRVTALHRLLQEAVSAEVRFGVGKQEYLLTLDLRFNATHASTGYNPNPGDGSNLPTGETYKAPYVGRRHPEIPSLTHGFWPVQFTDGAVVFRVEAGRIVGVLDEDDPVSLRELQKFLDEPGLSWLAELGLGVLDGLGVQAVGRYLLDEKLGLHIAWGESGDEITRADFKDPAKAFHHDIVYVPSLQPDIVVAGLVFVFADGSRQTIMVNGCYVDGIF